MQTTENTTPAGHPIDNMAPGTRLENGAYVLTTLAFADGGGIVLAFEPDNFFPFVTWRTFDTGGFAWGDYCSTLTEALENMNERASAFNGQSVKR